MTKLKEQTIIVLIPSIIFMVIIVILCVYISIQKDNTQQANLTQYVNPITGEQIPMSVGTYYDPCSVLAGEGIFIHNTMTDEITIMKANATYHLTYDDIKHCVDVN